MRLVLVIVGLAMLWGGGQGVYTSLANGDQVIATCASFDAAEHDAVWVRLDDCVPDWEQMTYASFGTSTSPTELFIPLRSPTASPDEPTQIVLATKDEALRDLASTMLRASDSTSEKTLELIAERVVAASQPQSYAGMVQFGIELDEEERGEIAGLAENLHQDFVMLEHGAEPSLLASFGALFGGLVALGLGIFLFVRRR